MWFVSSCGGAPCVARARSLAFLAHNSMEKRWVPGCLPSVRHCILKRYSTLRTVFCVLFSLPWAAGTVCGTAGMDNRGYVLPSPVARAVQLAREGSGGALRPAGGGLLLPHEHHLARPRDPLCQLFHRVHGRAHQVHSASQVCYDGRSERQERNPKGASRRSRFLCLRRSITNLQLCCPRSNHGTPSTERGMNPCHRLVAFIFKIRAFA